ncbi:ATP-binding protein [Neobacillus novalis]|uniref:ATP-binding protein n=1 Tax=Neobacillus novalis TaxID=220687 RepID=A0AA95SDA0_9BACI|nr:ATP-binding protein [Neobacillus novalis]WHY88589.1 ATP-binding protein [Neobacillus novalis]
MISLKNSYVPAHLAIEAMRDNGYKNTAYAVCELIDNSIQANASHVQLLCGEAERQLSTRRSSKLEQIAVLDNGDGMSPDVLALSLQFGNGTRLRKDQRTGIGRFGMGLPASSISQCKRVDVWSWQDGVENAYHVYLDVNEIKNTKSSSMPEPFKKAVPYIYSKVVKEFGRTGTLVVWSSIDRLMWNKGETLLRHSESLIGRIYRKFIHSNQLKIQMTVFDLDNPSYVSRDQLSKPNDPCYLMAKTNCPEPFHNKPMFEKHGGENYERIFRVNYKDQNHDIFVRTSIASLEARTDDNAGNTPHGKHAKDNTGISVVRAGRELELDQTLVSQSDPTERWWGIEVEFPPSLDELMGVTNNKQTARNFSDILGMIHQIIDLQRKGKDIDEIKEELEEEGDPRAPLIEVADYIYKQITSLRKLIKEQTKGMRSKSKRYENTEIEKKATEYTQERKRQGFVGSSDIDEALTPEEKVENIRTDLITSGVEEEEAQEIAVYTVTNNLKYSFTESYFESDAFFTVQPSGGALNILLNRNHPAYEHLIEVLDNNESSNSRDLQDRLEKASEGLRLLLAAWARFEDEIPDGERKDDIQDARKDWGRIAKKFLKK